LFEYLLNVDIDCIVDALSIELEHYEQVREELLNNLKEKINQKFEKENFFYNLLDTDNDNIL